MLPGINGYEICRLIRAEGLDMPIIMLTAKGQESDIILGLNLGADDYVTKPFQHPRIAGTSECISAETTSGRGPASSNSEISS